MFTIKKGKSTGTRLLAFFGLLTFCACDTIPEGLKAVRTFDKSRYLGKWYEIARMDFRFERDLNNTTATYSLNSDGSIKVLNKGYNYKTKEWKEASGKAKFVGPDSIAMLKVSFFGPFYAGYNVIALDSNYQYALIAGKDLSYLWILSRSPSIPDDIKQQYLEIARSSGFKTDELVWVEHQLP